MKDTSDGGEQTSSVPSPALSLAQECTRTSS